MTSSYSGSPFTVEACGCQSFYSQTYCSFHIHFNSAPFTSGPYCTATLFTGPFYDINNKFLAFGYVNSYVPQIVYGTNCTASISNPNDIVLLTSPGINCVSPYNASGCLYGYSASIICVE